MESDWKQGMETEPIPDRMTRSRRETQVKSMESETCDLSRINTHNIKRQVSQVSQKVDEVQTEFEDLQKKIGTLKEALKQENKWTRKLILVTFSITIFLIVMVAGSGVLGAITFIQTQGLHHNHTTC